MRTDEKLDDGSVLRIDPRTGRSRVVSGADYGRAQLTRERDAELSRQVGAPPVAKGPKRTKATEEAVVSTSPAPRVASPVPGVSKPVANASALFTPASPLKIDPKTGIDGNAPAAPVASTKPPAPTFDRAATNPNLPASYDQPMRNIAVAAGPNISTAPTGLPEGSAGYARKGGGYTVRTADGKTQDFADEAAARAAFAPPRFDAPYLDSTLKAVDQAKKDLIGSRPPSPAAATSQPKTAAPAPAAPSAELAPAYTLKGAGQRLGQSAAFLATDQTEANPANFLDTAERYGAASLGAVWDGKWNVPEKGLIRQGVEAVQERNPFVRAVGSAIGDMQADARQREAIAAGRIAPDFESRAARAQGTYWAKREPARQPNGAPTIPSFEQMKAEAQPIFPVSPALQRVVDAATQPPRPVATPSNAITRIPGRGVPQFNPPSVASFSLPEPSAFPVLIPNSGASRPRASFAAFL